MKFECGDLERALAHGSLIPEARNHLRDCATCRQEYRLWMEISATARQLHEEWETPQLWSDIRKKIEAEPKARPVWWKEWKTWAIAAALLIAVTVPLLIYRPAQPQPGTPADRDFLTEQALADVEKTEAAYRESIDKLTRLAEPKLDKNTTASAAGIREKLVLLDSAIADTRGNIELNRFNVSLQSTLAGLYKEKQQTLQELLTRDQKN